MEYDVIIIGAGPAGLAAAIYATRYKLKTLILGKDPGNASLAPVIENYPGFAEISGAELIEKMKSQVQALGIEVKQEEVIDIKKRDKGFVVTTKDLEYKSLSIILAVGTERRKLNLPNEDRFVGKGLAYCATCDAPLFKDKAVVVVGGGNAAAMSCQLLSEYAKKIYMVYLELFMDPIWLDRMKGNKRIEMIRGTVKELKGNKFLSSVVLDKGKELKVQGIFVEIGSVPSKFLTEKLGVKTDDQGYVVSENGKTNIPSVFSAGDINQSELKQIVVAAAEGAEAAYAAYLYLKK